MTNIPKKKEKERTNERNKDTEDDKLNCYGGFTSS